MNSNSSNSQTLQAWGGSKSVKNATLYRGKAHNFSTKSQQAAHLTLVQQSPAEAEEHGNHHSELNASCRKPFAVTVPKWHQVANEHTYMVFLKYFCISLHRNNTCLERAPGYLHFCAEKQQFSNSRSPVGRIDEFKFKQHLTCITSEKIPIFLWIPISQT